MTNTVVANQEIKTHFEQAYGKKLADGEVAEYKDRLVKFFGLLVEIDQRNKSKEVRKNEQQI